MLPPDSFLNRQYIHLEMLYNYFHAFLTSTLLLIFNFKQGTNTQSCSQKAPS